MHKHGIYITFYGIHASMVRVCRAISLRRFMIVHSHRSDLTHSQYVRPKNTRIKRNFWCRFEFYSLQHLSMNALSMRSKHAGSEKNTMSKRAEVRKNTMLPLNSSLNANGSGCDLFFYCLDQFFDHTQCEGDNWPWRYRHRLGERRQGWFNVNDASLHRIAGNIQFSLTKCKRLRP